MGSKFLQAFLSNAAFDCEEMLPRVSNRTINFKEVLVFCQNYRFMGITLLFLFGETDALQSYLYKSGRAFLYFLEQADERALVTSKSRPFFDAIAALDFDGAGQIALALPKARSEVEYEEDFLYFLFLRKHAFLQAAEAECADILAQWEQALQGAADPRLDVCKALLAHDDALFDDALLRFLEEAEAKWARLAEHDAVSQEELATEGHLSVEGLALVALAERFGMKTRSDYLFIPSSARAQTAPVASPDAWRVVRT